MKPVRPDVVRRLRRRLYRLSHGLAVGSHRALLALHSFVRASLAGVWLAILDRDDLLAVADAFYAGHERYGDEAYNLSGFQPWERSIVERYFSDVHRILLVGAGAGREVLAFAALDRYVRAYECNPHLVGIANRLLESQGHRSRVHLAPPDTCPATGEQFGGAVIGWGAYMLVFSRRRRVALLRAMRSQVDTGAPLLLSFFVRPENVRRFELIAAVANALRRVAGRDPVAVGDDLEPEYVHYFTRSELAAELAEADFRLEHFAETPYGHAVGIAR